MHVAAELRGADRRLPVAGLDPGIQLRHAPCGGHQQGEAEVGGGLGQHIRGVGEQDAALVQVGQLVVVVAHRDGRDDLQPAGTFELGATERPADAEQAVGLGQCRGVLGVDVAGRVEQGDVEIVPQALLVLGAETAEDEDVLFHGDPARQLGGVARGKDCPDAGARPASSSAGASSARPMASGEQALSSRRGVPPPRHHL
ncbi:hypothetical protein D3C75_764350 [compost metagenome]